MAVSFRDDSLTQLARAEAPDDFTYNMLQAIRLAGERSNSDQVSPKGARGVYQFMPTTFSKFADEGADPTDPLASTRAAARYIQYARQQYGDNPAAIAAEYNGGPRQANAVLKSGDALANETRAYIPRVLKHLSDNGGNSDARGDSKSLPGKASDPFGWSQATFGSNTSAKQDADPFGWSQMSSGFNNATEPPPPPATLMQRAKQGFSDTIDAAKLAGISATGNPDDIAAAIAKSNKAALPPSDAARQFQVEREAMTAADKDKSEWTKGLNALGLAGLQAIRDPKEFLGGMLQNMPNMLPGLAGGLAGGVAGASVAGPVGAAVGGVAGGFGGGFMIEAGSELRGRISEKMGALGLDATNPQAISQFLNDYGVNKMLSETRAKGATTASVDAVLNVATVGVLGAAKRTAQSALKNVEAAMVSGTLSKAEGQLAINGIEAAFAKTQTMPRTALRAVGTAGTEAVGEGAGEGLGQLVGYNSIDWHDVAQESLMGLGQGPVMSASAKIWSALAPKADPMQTTFANARTAANVPIEQAADAPITPVVTPEQIRALPSPDMPAGNGVMVQGPDGVRPQTFGEGTAAEQARRSADETAAERARLGLGEAERIQATGAERQAQAAEQQALQEQERLAATPALPSPDMPSTNGVLVQGESGVRPQTYGESVTAEQARIQADQIAAERNRLGLGEAQRIEARKVGEPTAAQPIIAQASAPVAPASAPVADIVSSTGAPFQTEKSALASIKARGIGETHTAVTVDGGFAIRSIDAGNLPAASIAQPAGSVGVLAGAQSDISGGSQRVSVGGDAQAIPGQSQSSAGVGAVNANVAANNGAALSRYATLTQALRNLGGLPSKYARDITGETAQNANKMPGYRGLFAEDGTDLSTLVHEGKLDAFLPPELRSDVRDNSRPTDTDAAIAHIEGLLRNGEAQQAKSYGKMEAAQQRAAVADAKQQPAQVIGDGPSVDAMNEAEYDHYVATGEPGFGWMPVVEAVQSATDEQLDALLNQPPNTDERAGMRAMGFTDEQITTALGPDATASTDLAASAQAEPGSNPQVVASGEAAPSQPEVAPAAASNQGEVSPPAAEVSAPKEPAVATKPTEDAAPKAPEQPREVAPVAAPEKAKPDLETLTVKTQVFVEDLGKSVTVETSAAVALNDAKKEVNRYEALLKCLRG